MSGPQGRVTFGWDLTYVCNYRCPYCTVWDQPTPTSHLTSTDWLGLWRGVYERHGECYIYMSGGEPSKHRAFYDLVEELTKMHVVDICTNLSWNVEKMIPRISRDRLRIAATFHPSQVLFKEYIEKVSYVKDYLPERPEGRAVYFVAYPSQVAEMAGYSARFQERGLALVPLPFVSTDHIIGNTDEEKEAIREISPNRGDTASKLEFQLKELVPKGRLCRAGQKYAMIRGDGKVDRCSQYTDRQVGNFLDKDFRLWAEPKICTLEWCPYESQWLVNDGKEAKQ